MVNDDKSSDTEQSDDSRGAEKAVTGEKSQGETGKNAVTSNASDKPRVPAEKQSVDKEDDDSAKSVDGPKGTEEPGSDEGPGGTGW